MEDGDSRSVWGIWTLVSAVFWSLFTCPAVSRRRKIEIEKKFIIEVYGEHRSDLCVCIVTLISNFKITVLLVAVGFSGAYPRLP